MKKCPACGTRNQDGAQICHACGAALPDQIQKQRIKTEGDAPKRKWVVPAILVLMAAVLCGTVFFLAPKALYERGKRCAEGEGADQSWEEAVKWYRAAAKLGYAQAQFAYGECYYDGNGVEQDYEQAVYWLRKSAEQDNSDAQCGLGACYLTGSGVPEGPEQAVYWFQKSAEQDHSDAQYGLGNCYQHGIGVERTKNRR